MARSGLTVLRELWDKTMISPRSFRDADACAAEHRGETGIVLAMRFAYGRGSVPHREWQEARITVDGHIICTASVYSRGARWVPVTPGAHVVDAQSLLTYSVLATCETTVAPGEQRIVSVLPKVRRGLWPLYRDGILTDERR